MIHEEIQKLHSLANVGMALVEYAQSLFPGLSLRANSQGRYVASPENFVTFSIHYQRTSNITVTLRGNPDEFLSYPELPLKPDMNGYSSFKLTEVGQLAAASAHIRRAAEIFSRGRERQPKTPVVVER